MESGKWVTVKSVTVYEMFNERVEMVSGHVYDSQPFLINRILSRSWMRLDTLISLTTGVSYEEIGGG